MKNLTVDKLNEKARNELKKESQGLTKKFHKWNFELDKKIYKLKNYMKKKNDIINNIVIFSSLIIVVLYGFYACLVNDIHLGQIIFCFFGFK